MLRVILWIVSRVSPLPVQERGAGAYDPNPDGDCSDEIIVHLEFRFQGTPRQLYTEEGWHAPGQCAAEVEAEGEVSSSFAQPQHAYHGFLQADALGGVIILLCACVF